MPRSPLALAAIATAAVPGLDAYDARRLGADGPDLDTALVVDAQRRRWVVRAPRHAAAGAALAAQAAFLTALGAQQLPFAVPRPVGTAALPDGGHAVVHEEIPGRPLALETLRPGPGLAASLGRAVAAVHELPTSLVDDLGLPSYEADDYRRRRQAEVDEAARTGRVPVALLRRWERKLEDVALWRFRPTVVHGDLTADRVLVHGGAVSGILGWGDARIADPADDLAWLLVAAPQDAADSVVEAYQLRRTELKDPHLVERALLAGELALVRWLLHGVRSGDADVQADALGMLTDLDAQVRAEQDAVAEARTQEHAAAV